MKIKLSKSQWESIGKDAGWVKMSQNIDPKPKPGTFAITLSMPQEALDRLMNDPVKLQAFKDNMLKMGFPVQDIVPHPTEDQKLPPQDGQTKTAQSNALPRKFKWTVVFEVDAKHVAAGFEITDDMVKNMIANAMPTVTPDEFNAFITTRPPASAIRLVQGG